MIFKNKFKTITSFLFMSLGISGALLYIFTQTNFIRFLNADMREDGPEIHVFIDVASGPSLLQLIELIKSSPQIPKIIAWQTIRDVHKKINLADFNAQEISYDNIPHEGHPEKEMTERAASLLINALKKNPESRIILHTNLYHAKYLVNSFIDKIKPYKIAHLHLYEDGFGNTTASRKLEILRNTFSSFKLNIKSDVLGYYLFKKYPTTYHLAFTEERRRDPDFKQFNRFFQNATVKETDFIRLKASLTDQEKKILKQVFDIAPEKYQNLYKKDSKPAAFLLTPWVRTIWEEEAHLNAILKILEDKRYFWILKPHPNMQSLKIIKKN